MSDILAEAQRISAANGGVPIVFGGCLHEARTPTTPVTTPTRSSVPPGSPTR